MPAVYLAPDPINSCQLIPGGVVPASGGKLFHYLAGSSTKTDVYTDITGLVKWANPIVLDSGGNLGGSNEVWIPAGVTVKFVLAPFNDTDPPIAPYKTWDNLSGINDPTSLLTEWVVGPTPTFVSTTSFTLVGDQTAIFTPGRRVKTTNTAGTRYGTISTSVFGAVTTVTITNDSGTLDAGLSAVWYGILSVNHDSIPNVVSVMRFGAVGDGVTDDTAAIVAAIAAAAASITPSTGQQATVLGPTGTYQLSSQVTVKRGVRFSGQAATFRPTAAGINMFLVEPGASLDCLIDTTNVTYTGQAITLDSTTSGASFDATAGRHSELKATMLGTAAQGTAVYFHENDVSGIAFVESNLTINGFSKGIDLFAEGAAGGFINGNRFHGTIRGATTAIDIRGGGVPSGNLFDMELQAVAGSTVRGWFVETGAYNLFTGYLWDIANFSTSAVEFGASAGTQNKALVPGDVDPAKVINSTSDATNVCGRIPVSQAVISTFLPVLKFGGASVGITYGTQSCRYSRIGQRVFFDMVLILTSKGSSVGVATITLPVTVNVFALIPAFSFSTAVSLAAGVTTSLLAFGSTNSTTLNLYRFAAGAITPLSDTDLTNTTELRISGSYEY